jgi:hypothetical protein
LPENKPSLPEPEPAASPETLPSAEIIPEIAKPLPSLETQVTPAPDSTPFSVPPRLITPEPQENLPDRFRRSIPEPDASTPVPPPVAEPMSPALSGSET